MLATLAAAVLAAGAASAASPETLAIELAHLTEGGRWRVGYRLAAPAEGLRFLRRFDHRRGLGWQPDDPALELVRDGPHEVLRRRDGRAFDHATLQLRSDRAPPVHDHPLTVAFSDGSEWIYPGHLYAVPVRAGRVLPQGARYELVLRPATGESVVIGGRRHAGIARWSDPDPEASGTLVYFGFRPLEAIAGFPAVIDPGLPGPLRRVLDEALPRIAALYRQQLGPLAAPPPALFVSYNPEASSRGRSGDVLPGAIAFRFAGAAWREGRVDDHDEALGLIAHELAHLWNGQRYRSSLHEEAPWMHEGGAEALAWLALRQLGLVDAPRFDARVARALQACTGPDGLRGRSLEQALAEQRYEFAYSCGALMNLLVHRAESPRGGLFAFWRALFDGASRRGDAYSSRDYLALVRHRAGPRAAERLDRLWRGPRPADAAAGLAAELRRDRVPPPQPPGV